MTVEKTTPTHWESKRLKYVATYNDEVLPEGTDEDRDVDYVEIAGVSLSEGLKEINRLTFGEAPSRARRVVKSGDVLISTVRTYLKAIAKVDKASDDLIASTGFCVVRPDKDVDSSYIGWAAKSEQFVEEVVARSVGVSYPAINASDLVNIQVPLPPLATQQRITSFLDEKTAKIDGLIWKKRALLDRLAEKRQALITQAVTKGLNPDAPMKPSGIDWLGEIPAHWEVRRLNSFCHFQSGKAHEPFIDEEGSFICVNARYISTNGHTAKHCTVNLTPASNGDILMVMSDLPNGRALARSFLVDENDKYAVNQRVCRIRPSIGISDFFSYQLNRNPQLMSYDDGKEQTHLSNSAFKLVQLLVPPHEEQEQIVRYLNAVASKTEQTETMAMRSIDLLTEYRSALITSAVTGQIEGLQ